LKKKTLNREICSVTAYGQGRIGKLYLRVCTLTAGYQSTKKIPSIVTQKSVKIRYS